MIEDIFGENGDHDLIHSIKNRSKLLGSLRKHHADNTFFIDTNELNIISIENKKVLTKTSLFILPLVVDSSFNSIVLNNTNFYNCYLIPSKNRAGLYDFSGIMFLVKGPVSTEFKNLLNKTLYKSYSTINNDSFIKVEYDFKNYLDDISKILKGEYSKISHRAKVKIIDFWNLKGPINDTKRFVLSTIQASMTKKKSLECLLNARLPSNEVLSKPKLVNEIYKNSKLYTLVNYE